MRSRVASHSIERFEMTGLVRVTTLTIIEPHHRISPAIENAMIATPKNSSRTVPLCRYPIPPTASIVAVA